MQGRKVVDRLDIFERVGKNKALDLSFDDVEVTDGQLKIGFLKDISSQLIGADKRKARASTSSFPALPASWPKGRRKPSRSTAAARPGTITWRTPAR